MNGPSGDGPQGVGNSSNVPLPVFLAAANILSEGSASNPIVDPRKRKKKKKKPGPMKNAELASEEIAVAIARKPYVPLEVNRTQQSSSSSQIETHNAASSSRAISSLLQETQTSGSPLRELNLDLIQKLWLDVNHIATLKKRSPKHPNAIFVCRLCQYFCTSLEHCENHVKDQKHLRNASEEGRINTLTSLPNPTEYHKEAVTEMLYNVATNFGINSEEQEQRKKIADGINSLLVKGLPGSEARMYGSSITGFGLKSANINLDFVVEHSSLNAPSMLKVAYNLLKDSDLVTCVMKDFHAEIPSVLFLDKTKTFNCVLSLNSHEAYKTSELLAKYQKLDERYRILCTSFRFWAKLCKVDDHLIGTLPSYSYNLMLVYFLQQLQPPVLPILKESDKEISWKSKNLCSVGELWLQLLRFYSIIHPATDNVVCVRSDEPIRRSEKHWTGKKIAIEDPYLRKRNVSRYIINHASHEYIMECFKNTYKYFGIPQTDIGPIFAFIRTPMEEYRQIPDVERNIRLAEKAMDDLMNNDARFMAALPVEQPIRTSLNNMISVSELEEKLRDASLHNNKTDMPDTLAMESRPLENGPSIRTMQQVPKVIRPGQYSQLVVSPKLASALCSRLRKECYIFKMDAKIFTGGKQPPIVCNICQQEGHTKSRCPDNYLPPLQPLPPMTEEFLQDIDKVCHQILAIWSPTKEEVEERTSLVSDLEKFLKEDRYPEIKLELFGSSCNGFGFHKSDLDICMTFNNIEKGDPSQYGRIIEGLAVDLKAYGKLTNIIPITTAKVPIVKFTYPKSKLDCDISLYNKLAQRNTRMLKMYSEIDIRVKMIGFTMKRFAKLCDICDASKGSLSSYAYILMALYFLQQCNPPVIPVLQQLYFTETKPELVVETANTWFYDNLENLPNIWPGYGQNKCSAGELWLQLLRFYTEEFDFSEHVVSIRQKDKLLRFEKLWNSKCMAIEDPFDLTHNLGTGLSRKMNNFIIKAFRRGRMHFGTPISQLLPPYKELQDYLFDTKYLTDGQPPNDRGCRICKKIGHICKDCPQRKSGKRRQGDKKGRDHKGSPSQDNKERGQQPIQQQQRNNTPFRVSEGQGWGGQRNRGEQSRGQQETQQKQLRQIPPIFRSYPNDQSKMQQQQQQTPPHQQQQQQQQQSPQPRIPSISSVPPQCPQNYTLLENPRAGASKREMFNNIQSSIPDIRLQETLELAQENVIPDDQQMLMEHQVHSTELPQTPDLAMIDQAIQICSKLQKQNDITSSVFNNDLNGCVIVPNELTINTGAQDVPINVVNASASNHSILHGPPSAAASPTANMANVLDNLKKMLHLENNSQLESNELCLPLVSHMPSINPQANNSVPINTYVYNQNMRHPYNMSPNPIHVPQITQTAQAGNCHENNVGRLNPQYQMSRPPPGFQNTMPPWMNQQTPYYGSTRNIEEGVDANMSYGNPPTAHPPCNAESHVPNMSPSIHVGIPTILHSNYNIPMMPPRNTPSYNYWPGLHGPDMTTAEARQFQQRVPQQPICNFYTIVHTPSHDSEIPFRGHFGNY